MTQHKGESAIKYMRRIVSNLNYESESFLEDMTTIPMLIEYFELWSIYDTDFCQGIIECIESGESAKPYNDFVKKNNLPWLIYKGKQWTERKAA